MQPFRYKVVGFQIQQGGVGVVSVPCAALHRGFPARPLTFRSVDAKAPIGQLNEIPTAAKSGLRCPR